MFFYIKKIYKHKNILYLISFIITKEIMLTPVFTAILITPKNIKIRIFLYFFIQKDIKNSTY